MFDAVPLRVELSVVAREGLGQRHLGRVAPRDDGQEISTVIVFCSPMNMGKGCVSAILFHATFDHAYLDGRAFLCSTAQLGEGMEKVRGTWNKHFTNVMLKVSFVPSH